MPAQGNALGVAEKQDHPYPPKELPELLSGIEGGRGTHLPPPPGENFPGCPGYPGTSAINSITNEYQPKERGGQEGEKGNAVSQTGCDRASAIDYATFLGFFFSEPA